jgi:hypothetical protein
MLSYCTYQVVDVVVVVHAVSTLFNVKVHNVGLSDITFLRFKRHTWRSSTEAQAIPGMARNRGIWAVSRKTNAFAISL